MSVDDTSSSLPLQFPDMGVWAARGYCGKKNSVSTPMVLGLPIPFRRFAGGSGKPRNEDVSDPGEGSVVRWQYNNMISYSPLLGWVIMRLDPERESTAVLGAIDFGGTRRLSVRGVSLRFVVLVPRFGLRFRAAEPLELVLDRVVTDEHMLYRGRRPMTIVEVLGVPLVGLRSQEVSVTSSRLLSITDVERDGDSLAVTIERDESFSTPRGPIVWFVHSPEETGSLIPVGHVTFGESHVTEVTVDVGEYPNLREAERLYVEAGGTADPRHPWAMRKWSA